MGFVGIERKNEGSCGLIGTITVNVDLPSGFIFCSNDAGTDLTVAWNRSLGPQGLDFSSDDYQFNDEWLWLTGCLQNI